MGNARAVQLLRPEVRFLLTALLATLTGKPNIKYAGPGDRLSHGVCSCREGSDCRYFASPRTQGPSSPSRSLVARVDDIEVIYHKATCKGQKLLSATTSPHEAAAAFVNPIDSPWTNPIQQELETWGYKIESDDGTPQFRASHEDECEFEHSHKLKSMFDDLRIDTRSTYQGGPNRCYFINHKDGPAVRRDNQGDLPPVKQQWYKANDQYYRVGKRR